MRAEIKVCGRWGAMGRDERRAFLAARLRDMAQAVEDDRFDNAVLRSPNGNTTRIRVTVQDSATE
jgi:hypothetical protein